MSAASHPPALHIERFAGGGRWIRAGGIAGVVFLLLTVVGFVIDPKEAFVSYLVAFAYWCGLSIASIVLVLIMHAFKARWVTVVRRPIEVMAASILIFAILLIPVLLGLRHIYVWIDPPADLGRETLQLLAKKRVYLNREFFIARSAIYFALWIFLGLRLFGLSNRQDTSEPNGAIDVLRRLRRLGPGGLPFIALTFSFAAFDWLMSVNPTWFSTIFGVYYFAGSFVATLSLWAVVTYAGRNKNLYGAHMTVEHTHNIGKLMLAFTCFWTYIAFSQLMLIWIAGLPEEIPFYIVRFRGAWAWLGIIFLMIGHFFIPFGALLSRSLKRDPRKLALVGLWILFVHYIDIYWLVLPTFHPEGLTLHWTAVTAFLGIGGVSMAYAVSRLRGRYAVPLKDPYLAQSLRYRQP